MKEKCKQLQDWIDQSESIVFFGGAGVSTESGIPDFRSVDGLYNMSYKYPPETIISRSFFDANPVEFYRFYRDKMLFLEAKPNPAHLKLGELEGAGKVRAVVTQNIDGLHQDGGSQNIYELHGSVRRNYCMKCHAFYDLAFMLEGEGVPKCTKCGGTIKPDVVLYEEGLDSATMEGAVEAIASADMLIVGGTSLGVYPAAGLLRYYRGHKLVLINKSETPYDGKADLIISAPIGEILGQITVSL